GFLQRYRSIWWDPTWPPGPESAAVPPSVRSLSGWHVRCQSLGLRGLRLCNTWYAASSLFHKDAERLCIRGYAWPAWRSARSPNPSSLSPAERKAFWPLRPELGNRMTQSRLGRFLPALQTPKSPLTLPFLARSS